VDELAAALGERFPEVDVPKFRRHPAFRRNGAAALASLGGVAAVVGEVSAYGGTAGAADIHRVLVARLGWAVEDAAAHRKIVEDRSEADRWAAVSRAAKRGETLRALVDRGDLFLDEAVASLAREFLDDDLRGLAEAALTGGAK
jgi:hypothetical protein